MTDINVQLAIKKLEFQKAQNDLNICQWEQRLLEIEIDRQKFTISIQQATDQNHEFDQKIKELGGPQNV